MTSYPRHDPQIDPKVIPIPKRSLCFTRIHFNVIHSIQRIAEQPVLDKTFESWIGGGGGRGGGQMQFSQLLNLSNFDFILKKEVFFPFFITINLST